MKLEGEKEKRDFRVRPIKDGTVIDHIPAGQALNVLKILGVTSSTIPRDTVISVVMNVPSHAIGRKDIVKVENRELKPEEVDKISLIAPTATINIIRNFEVSKKYKVSLPEQIEGIVRCANPSCISNTPEPLRSKFIVEKRENRRQLRCLYCERVISENIAEHLI
ncbi:MAG: aspartate carbamoyltransferase regulatory subunit [Methanocellales archaeon]